MTAKVVVLDYGSGNLRSAQRALERVGADVEVTADADAAMSADGLVVPGVGAFEACMTGLRKIGGDKIIADRVENGPLPGLREALQRITERASRFRSSPQSIVHMDYHPLNVMVHGVRVTGVIDWVNTDVGDRHLDAAMTAVILSSSALDHPRWMRDNLVGNGLRASFAALYMPLYHAMAPMNFERFRYCQAVAALLRLSMLGMMRARGPEIVGFRPESISEVTPAVVRLLSRYATRKSGAATRLDMATPQPA